MPSSSSPRPPAACAGSRRRRRPPPGPAAGRSGRQRRRRARRAAAPTVGIGQHLCERPSLRRSPSPLLLPAPPSESEVRKTEGGPREMYISPQIILALESLSTDDNSPYVRHLLAPQRRCPCPSHGLGSGCMRRARAHPGLGASGRRASLHVGCVAGSGCGDCLAGPGGSAARSACGATGTRRGLHARARSRAEPVKQRPRPLLRQQISRLRTASTKSSSPGWLRAPTGMADGCIGAGRAVGRTYQPRDG